MIKNMIPTAKSLFYKYRHGLVLLYIFLYIPWFQYLESRKHIHFNVVHLAIDDYIPFCEYFIVPYMLWFGYVTFAVLYFFLKNKSDFYKICIFLFTGMTVFLLISTFYPNIQYLRPETFARNNTFVHMVQWLYHSDTPTDLFPSIHVYNSLGVHLAIINSESFKDNKKVKSFSFVLMVSIILSTMFLKQHSVFDVLTAFVLAAVMHSFVYIKNTQKEEVYQQQQIHNI